MIIYRPDVQPTPEPTMANRIDNGMVFTGDLWEFHQFHIKGIFLKVHGHVVCLDNNLIYGAGATSTTRIFNYKSWPGSTLMVEDFYREHDGSAHIR